MHEYINAFIEKINNILNALSKSKFRSKFHIKEKEIKYIEEKGIEKSIISC